MLQVSTGFKAALLAGWPSIFNRGVIALYAGARPLTADGAANSAPLGVVTQGGYHWAVGDDANGLWYASEGPYIVKPVGAQWAAYIVNSGTASWFRVYGPSADIGDVSYSAPRVDGDIGTDVASGAELILPSTALLAGDYVPIQSFLYTIPPIVS